MARRNKEESTLGDVIKDFIEANRLQKGLDKVSVKEAWHA
ncbi:MAG: RNA-binding protein, partial [Flavobacteriaceae bacterium]|nr:RNA-binding protein [Flavobacteriaceae bacterium]